MLRADGEAITVGAVTKMSKSKRNTVDPEVFIIGGGMAETLGKPLLPRLSVMMAETSVLYRRNRPKLVMAQLGDDAVAVGAAVAAGRRA